MDIPRKGKTSAYWTHSFDHESKEHWHLQNQYRQRWKHYYPEDMLASLSRVFANMEWLGLRCNAEVMQKVASVSRDEIEAYRRFCADKLKRTFFDSMEPIDGYSIEDFVSDISDIEKPVSPKSYLTDASTEVPSSTMITDDSIRKICNKSRPTPSTPTIMLGNTRTSQYSSLADPTDKQSSHLKDSYTSRSTTSQAQDITSKSLSTSSQANHTMPEPIDKSEKFLQNVGRTEEEERCLPAACGTAQTWAHSSLPHKSQALISPSEPLGYQENSTMYLSLPSSCPWEAVANKAQKRRKHQAARNYSVSSKPAEVPSKKNIQLTCTTINAVQPGQVSTKKKKKQKLQPTTVTTAVETSNKACIPLGNLNCTIINAVHPAQDSTKKKKKQKIPPNINNTAVEAADKTPYRPRSKRAKSPAAKRLKRAAAKESKRAKAEGNNPQNLASEAAPVRPSSSVASANGEGSGPVRQSQSNQLAGGSNASSNSKGEGLTAAEKAPKAADPAKFQVTAAVPLQPPRSALRILKEKREKRNLEANGRPKPKKPRLDDSIPPEEERKNSKIEPNPAAVNDPVIHAESLRNNELCVAITTDPLKDLTQAEVDSILEQLIAELDRDRERVTSDSGAVKIIASFRGRPFLSDGVLKLWCEDDFALNWLKRTIPIIPFPCQDTRLVVKRQLEIPRKIKCGLYVPKFEGDLQFVHDKLTSQNPWYQVCTWSIYDVQVLGIPPCAAFLVLGIPQEDVTRLMERGRRVSFGLGSIYMRFFRVAKGGGLNRESTS